jgi:sulfite reductase alpha subunit-like flavoprotein
MVREARRLHFRTEISTMDEFNVRNLINERLVAFVCSTTGQGKAYGFVS